MEVTVHLLIVLTHLGNPLDRMHDGGVVTATKGFADFGKAFLGEFLREIHGDLTRPGDVRRATLAVHVGHLDLEEIRHGPLDRLDRNRRPVERENVLERLAGEFSANGPVAKARKGDYAKQGALEFTDI